MSCTPPRCPHPVVQPICNRGEKTPIGQKLSARRVIGNQKVNAAGCRGSRSFDVARPGHLDERRQRHAGAPCSQAPPEALGWRESKGDGLRAQGVGEGPIAIGGGERGEAPATRRIDEELRRTADWKVERPKTDLFDYDRVRSGTDYVPGELCSVQRNRRSGKGLCAAPR